MTIKLAIMFGVKAIILLFILGVPVVFAIVNKIKADRTITDLTRLPILSAAVPQTP